MSRTPNFFSTENSIFDEINNEDDEQIIERETTIIQKLESKDVNFERDDKIHPIGTRDSEIDIIQK